VTVAGKIPFNSYSSAACPQIKRGTWGTQSILSQGRSGEGMGGYQQYCRRQMQSYESAVGFL